MWVLDDLAPLPLWRPDGTGDIPVLAFSTRLGGVSAPPYDSLNLGRSTPDAPEAVAENRRRVLSALGLDPARLATAGQVHGSEVRRAHRPGHAPGCDALVTTESDLALAVTTADCLPLIYTAPGTVAVAHAGWRGTAADIAVAVLQAICKAAGVGADRVAVHLGPCIRACCYEIRTDVARRFPAAVVTPSGDRWRLDLPAATRLQLTQAGLPATAVADVGACTACDPRRYFSHRRDRGIAGRHSAIAALRS